MLLLRNKKFFQFVSILVDKVPYLYKYPEEKRKTFDKELELVSFFRDGQYNITTMNPNYIADFVSFWQAEQTKKTLFKKELKLIVQEMVEEVERRDKIRI